METKVYLYVNWKIPSIDDLQFMGLYFSENIVTFCLLSIRFPSNTPLAFNPYSYPQTRSIMFSCFKEAT